MPRGSRAELSLCSAAVGPQGNLPLFMRVMLVSVNGFSFQARRASFQTIQVREPDVLICYRNVNK